VKSNQASASRAGLAQITTKPDRFIGWFPAPKHPLTG